LTPLYSSILSHEVMSKEIYMDERRLSIPKRDLAEKVTRATGRCHFKFGRKDWERFIAGCRGNETQSGATIVRPEKEKPPIWKHAGARGRQ
jgi:hypothetical protein